MKVTPPLTLKALASRIHGQLPLNARESDKLLNLLKTSFRNQLDTVHPDQDAPSWNHSSTVQRTPQSAFLSANRNIDAMINNPLLAHKPKNTISKQPDLTARFLESIVYGTATLDGAKHYLKSMSLAQSKAETVRTVTRVPPAGAGAIVLDWLRSTALDRSEEFLHDVNLVKLLTRQLFMENKHKLLMKELLLESEIVKDNEVDMKHGQAWRYQQYWKHQIVSCMINTSVERGDHPEVTINHFLEILADCKKAQLQHFTFLKAAAEQIGLLTVARRHELSASLYDDFIMSCSSLIPPRHRASAMLHLYHPSRPNPGPALWFLRISQKDPRLASMADEANANIPISHRLLREDVLNICLDSAPLIAKWSPSDSAWVLDFATRHFQPGQVNPEQEENRVSRTTQNHEEAEESRLCHELHPDPKGFAFG